MKLRQVLAFGVSFAVLSLTSLADVKFGLEAVHLIIFALAAGFVYVGYEKLLCTGDKPKFRAAEFFLCAAVIPASVWAVLAILFPGICFAPAIVSVGAVFYRILWEPIDRLIKK